MHFRLKRSYESVLTSSAVSRMSCSSYLDGFIDGRSVAADAETITYADYADDIVLLANTPTKTESLPHSLEQAARALDSM